MKKRTAKKVAKKVSPPRKQTTWEAIPIVRSPRDDVNHKVKPSRKHTS